MHTSPDPYASYHFAIFFSLRMRGTFFLTIGCQTIMPVSYPSGFSHWLFPPIVHVACVLHWNAVAHSGKGLTQHQCLLLLWDVDTKFWVRMRLLEQITAFTPTFAALWKWLIIFMMLPQTKDGWTTWDWKHVFHKQYVIENFPLQCFALSVCFGRRPVPF